MHGEQARPVLPAPQPMRSAIRLDQVVAAFDDAKLSVEAAQVRLLAEVTSATPEPRLEVRGAEPWGNLSARVRIGCVSHAECLPFYVAVDWTDESVAKAALHSAAVFPSASTRRGAYERPASSPSAKAVLAAPPVQARLTEIANSNSVRSPDTAVQRITDRAPLEASVHAGTHATLLIDGQRLHIKVPVICLESGAPGRTIRVTALDHKQIYKAEVIDGTLLKGTL